MWIWQQSDWPDAMRNIGYECSINDPALAPRLRHLHFLMGILVGRISYLETESTESDTLLAKIVGGGEVVGTQVDVEKLRLAMECHSQDPARGAAIRSLKGCYQCTWMFETT